MDSKNPSFFALGNRFVKKHNGRIEARNVPGAGACFRITLPIRQPSLDAA